MGFMIDELDKHRARKERIERVRKEVQLADPSYRAQCTSKAPQAVVKVATQLRGTSVLRGMDYVSRKGELELETENGEALKGQSQIKDRFDDWKSDFKDGPPDSKRPPRHATHMILSARCEPSEKNLKMLSSAARQFLQERFGDQGVEYVWAVHADKDNPHVHVILKNYNRSTDKMLRLNKPELEAMRGEFADELTARGLEHVATRRLDRPETVKKILEGKEPIRSDKSWYRATLERIEREHSAPGQPSGWLKKQMSRIDAMSSAPKRQLLSNERLALLQDIENKRRGLFRLAEAKPSPKTQAKLQKIAGELTALSSELAILTRKENQQPQADRQSTAADRPEQASPAPAAATLAKIEAFQERLEQLPLDQLQQLYERELQANRQAVAAQDLQRSLEHSQRASQIGTELENRAMRADEAEASPAPAAAALAKIEAFQEQIEHLPLGQLQQLYERELQANRQAVAAQDLQRSLEHSQRASQIGTELENRAMRADEAEARAGAGARPGAVEPDQQPTAADRAGQTHQPDNAKSETEKGHGDTRPEQRQRGESERTTGNGQPGAVLGQRSDGRDGGGQSERIGSERAGAARGGESERRKLPGKFVDAFDQRDPFRPERSPKHGLHQVPRGNLDVAAQRKSDGLLQADAPQPRNGTGGVRRAGDIRSNGGTSLTRQERYKANLVLIEQKHSMAGQPQGWLIKQMGKIDVMAKKIGRTSLSPEQFDSLEKIKQTRKALLSLAQEKPTDKTKDKLKELGESLKAHSLKLAALSRDNQLQKLLQDKPQEKKSSREVLEDRRRTEKTVADVIRRQADGLSKAAEHIKNNTLDPATRVQELKGLERFKRDLERSVSKTVEREK